MIENDGDHEETTMEIQEIPLPNVPGHILVKVIKFMHHYDHDPMVEIDKVVANHTSSNDIPLIVSYLDM